MLLALGLAWPGAESWPLVSGHDPDPAGLLVESRHGRLPADLYEAPGSIRGIVLVHGLSRSGRRHPEIMRLLGQLRYRYSYAQNVLRHSVECGFFGGLMAAELRLPVKVARRAALLHDIGKLGGFPLFITIVLLVS